ncbi:hypothetical protein [Streptacidiphilus sp. MAP5-3]|uniref:hypothetical protein n=1 Tax=unclassified Streptacidiphilus TaxID=2643834 RepID=UPI003517C259
MHLFVTVFTAAAIAAPTPVPASVPNQDAPHHVDTMAWLVPVLLGLLLTAIACYKHRGLPSGH